MGSYSGVIKKAFEKDGRQSFLMDDDNWYGLGHNHKDAQDGDSAKFDFEMNGKYKNVVKGSCKIKKGTGAASGGAKGKSDYASREKFWSDKEARDIDTQMKISFAGALNTATNMANAMIAAELLKLGGKKADAWDAYEAFVLDLAETLYVRIQSQPDFHDELMEGGPDHKYPVPEGLEAPQPNIGETDDDDGEEDWV